MATSRKATQMKFDGDCQRCPRLATFLAASKQRYPDYHCRPVAPFGDPKARLLIVGLAPGLHGANATGRPFTGDHAGILLYQTLFDFGFASAAQSQALSDGLQLRDCRITNAVKCVPPENKPLGDEINTCNSFLHTELQDARIKVILALGTIAHNAVLKASGYKVSQAKFAHHASHVLPNGICLLDSYHCSRYNTQTRRLTPDMFQAVFATARALLDKL